jgi:hypothetical protein
VRGRKAPPVGRLRVARDGTVALRLLCGALNGCDRSVRVLAGARRRHVVVATGRVTVHGLEYVRLAIRPIAYRLARRAPASGLLVRVQIRDDKRWMQLGAPVRLRFPHA